MRLIFKLKSVAIYFLPDPVLSVDAVAQSTARPQVNEEHKHDSLFVGTVLKVYNQGFM
jgi:hypothetical protein